MERNQTQVWSLVWSQQKRKKIKQAYIWRVSARPSDQQAFWNIRVLLFWDHWSYFRTPILAVYFCVAQFSPHRTNYVFPLFFLSSLVPTLSCIPFHDLLLLLLLVDRFKKKKKKTPKPESDKANTGLRPHACAHVIELEMLCLFPSKLTSSKQGTKRQN